jgi:hypothetical protein
VIILNEKNGEITCQKIDDTEHFVLQNSSSEVNYFTFDIASTDYHTALYGELQNKTNTSVIKCDEYIMDFISTNELINTKDIQIYKKSDEYNGKIYKTLSTYIRNAIHHPDSGRTFSNDELRSSIKLLIMIHEKISSSITFKI